jgi:hypothetical protein
MSSDKQFIDFRKEVEKLKEIDGAEEYAKQLAHLFLGNGLSLQTILLMAIDFGQQHPHWISVEDELPPIAYHDDLSENYLVVDSDGELLIAYYDAKNKLWFSVDSNPKIYDVTHWMPIVPPRKEE